MTSFGRRRILRDTPRLIVMRTGAGSPASLAVISALRRSGCEVVAADSDPRSVGFLFSDAWEVVPRADAPDFVAKVLAAACRHRVDLILPAVDEELLPLARAVELFAAEGIGLALSPAGSVEVATDKWEAYRVLTDLGIPMPLTFNLEEEPAPAVPLPAVIKPRRGRGSRDVYLARTPEELEFFSRFVPGSIAQARCSGVEMTIDLLADLRGELLALVPRERWATESGISSKGVTRECPEIIPLVGRIARELPIHGPACIQAFMDEDGIRFTDVNLRFGGGVALSIAAGSMLIDGLVRLARGEPVEADLSFRPNLAFLRYWKETYVDLATGRVEDGQTAVPLQSEILR